MPDCSTWLAPSTLSSALMRHRRTLRNLLQLLTSPDRPIMDFIKINQSIIHEPSPRHSRERPFPGAHPLRHVVQVYFAATLFRDILHLSCIATSLLPSVDVRPRGVGSTTGGGGSIVGSGLIIVRIANSVDFIRVSKQKQHEMNEMRTRSGVASSSAHIVMCDALYTSHPENAVRVRVI